MVLQVLFLLSCPICTWWLFPLLFISWLLGYVFWSIYSKKKYVNRIKELEVEVVRINSIASNLEKELVDSKSDKEKLELAHNHLVDSKLNLERELIISKEAAKNKANLSAMMVNAEPRLEIDPLPIIPLEEEEHIEIELENDKSILFQNRIASKKQEEEEIEQDLTNPQEYENIENENLEIESLDESEEESKSELENEEELESKEEPEEELESKLEIEEEPEIELEQVDDEDLKSFAKEAPKDLMQKEAIPNDNTISPIMPSKFMQGQQLDRSMDIPPNASAPMENDIQAPPPPTPIPKRKSEMERIELYKIQNSKEDTPEDYGMETIFEEDNLQVIEGVGPKIEALLKAAGFSNWAKVGAASLEELQTVLDNAGPRYRIHKPDSWAEQAKLAADGDWEKLVKVQKYLDTEKIDSITKLAPSKIEKMYAKKIGFVAFKPGDFKIIEGIGPKIESLLKDGGIDTLEQLSKTSVSHIQEILNAAGDRYRLADPSSWSRQAFLANKNRWAELKSYQNILRGVK